jgi:ribonucleotide reductase alpha subunit
MNSALLRYIVKRVLLMIPTLLGVITLTFAVIQFVPGGPVEQMMLEIKGRGDASVGAGESSGGGSSSSTYRGRQGIDEERLKEIKALYATAFEVDATWLVEAASRRQKWIDQAQSLNIYMAGASGKKLDDTYKLAWLRGLKTTYYLRTMGATHAEKSTVQAGKLNSVASGNTSDTGSMNAMDAAAATAHAQLSASPATDIKFCAIDDPGCEACQ